MAAALAAVLLVSSAPLIFADEITSIDVTNASSGDTGATPEVNLGPTTPAESSAEIFNRYFTESPYAQTGRQLESARQEKQNTEKKLDRTEEAIEDLQEEKADIQTYLIQVNDKLQQANAQMLEYEALVDTKTREIEKAADTIEDAKEQQVVRKQNMKGRIKYMYEQGSESYLDILLSAKSFSDFLNKAQYFESINKYDKKMLEQYGQIEKEIAVQEQELVEQQETLKVLASESEKKAMEVYSEVIEASASMNEYAEQIAEKEAMALAYEQEIAEQEENIESLMEQYKRELAISTEAAAMGSRDLSDVVFENGDLDLMAAMIECEAGGESYTGKVAVGAVILNRVRSPKFPSTVLEVLMQNRQFAPVASGRFAMVLARGANASCYQAAQDAMAGASPVGGCLFFRTPIPGLVGQQIGGHIFY
ncbi:MAG: cell wall hydrolase [Lachnospiraceae bacterium]|nr:cell wall hydrolase [Lachnospiraceae bacterium]